LGQTANNFCIIATIILFNTIYKILIWLLEPNS